MERLAGELEVMTLSYDVRLADRVALVPASQLRPVLGQVLLDLLLMVEAVADVDRALEHLGAGDE